MSQSQDTAGLFHVAIERRTGSPLGESQLSDRGRISLILQASALLSHLETATWRLDSDWHDLRIDSEGLLCGARVTPGSDSQPAQTRLVHLTKTLFSVRGQFAGKGQAKRWAARSCSRWRRFPGRLPANRIVIETLDELDFLWRRQFASARQALVAELRSVEGSRVLVAGRGGFELCLRAMTSERTALESVVSSAEAGGLWKVCQSRGWRVDPDGTRLAMARDLCFRGRWQKALDALAGCHEASAELVRADCLRCLGRLAAAKNLIGKQPVPKLTSESGLLEYLRVAHQVYLDLGETVRAAKLLKPYRLTLSSTGNAIGDLLSAETAARASDWQSVGRLLGRMDGLEVSSDWLWRLERLSMALARSHGDLDEAQRYGSLALARYRRSIPRREAASMWKDLASIRLERGDLRGADRAGRHALRLLESLEESAAEGAHRWLIDLQLRQGRCRDLDGALESTRSDKGWSQDAVDPNLRELRVRADLVCGRPAEALSRARGALEQGTGPATARVRVLAARALGWLGRGAEARELLDGQQASNRGALEPEEYPAVWALAGDWSRAREQVRDDAIGRIWRGVLEGGTVSQECWRALRDLGRFRAARLVFDLQILSPGRVPRQWVERAVESLREVGADSFAERLDRSSTGSWRALETFLGSSTSGGRDLAYLFSDAGYFDARLEWRHRERTQILVDGSGGTNELRAPTRGGELVLSVQSLDAAIRALFALAVRDFEPDRENSPEEPSRVRGILGRSRVLKETLLRLERLAGSDIPVLICGESGTGKELAARQLHHLSARSSHPLVPVNCAALSEALLLADLFGHVRGAFTGADRDRAGVFEAALGGTVMLDEIGDLPLAAQGKLLRVLQEGEVRRVGESIPRKIDVRIVTATHRDLGSMVKQQTFREDLYYRLHVGSLTLPPLRSRGRDVLLLADHFTERSGYGLTSRARNALLRHSWPGNVRELRNVLQVAMAMSREATIDVQDLELPCTKAGPTLGYHQQVDQLRRDLVSKALAASEGRRAVAARELGVSRQAVAYLIRRFGLQ